MLKAAQFLNEKGVAPIVLLVIFLVVAVAGGSYFQFVYKPKLIKESTNKIQTDFKALNSSTDDLLKKFEDKSGGSDSESLKKNVKETKELADKVEQDTNNLTKSLSSKQSEVKVYSDAVGAYHTNAQEYLKFSKGGLGLAEGVADSLEEITTIGTTLQTAGSDPAIVSQKLQQSKSKIEQSIKDAEKIDVSAEYKDMKTAYVDFLELIRDFLSDADKALLANDGAALNTALASFGQNLNEITTRMNSSGAALEEKQKEFRSNLEEKAEKASEEYNNLDQKYK